MNSLTLSAFQGLLHLARDKSFFQIHQKAPEYY